MNVQFIDWGLIVSHLLSVCAAYAMALPIALDREQRERSAGLRTFPLVAVASCGYMLLATKVFYGDAQSQARVVEGLMTGIGFIGGGAILKHGMSVHGTATAASIWNTGAIGASVAYGRYEIALVLSLINFLTLHFLTGVKSDSAEKNNVEKSEEEKLS